MSSLFYKQNNSIDEKKNNFLLPDPQNEKTESATPDALFTVAVATWET